MIRFYYACLVALLRNQVLDFERSARYPYRFAAYLIMLFYVFAVGVLLKDMEPHYAFMYENVFVLPVFSVAVFLAVHLGTAIYVGLRIRDVGRSL